MSIPKQISCIKLAIEKLHPDWTVTPQSNAFKEFKLFSIILKEPEELSRQEQSSRLFEPNPEVSEDQYDGGPHLPAAQTRPRSHSNRSQHNTNPAISSISSSKLDADEYFLYFKLHYTPETSSYIKSKHKKIFAKFNVLLVNILIQELSHNYKQRIFLLRSQQNYISLSELKGNDFRRSEIEHFIIRVIQFFGKILEINKQTKIRIRINKHTIFLSENKDLKLGDYNLFFHHFREKDQEMKVYSEDYLMGKMVELVYYISNKNEENQFDFAEEGNTRVNKGRVVRRVLELQEMERTTAQRIIYSFVEERKINHQEIDEYFREQYHSQSTETIREHNENLNITTRSQISLPLNFSISHDQPAQSFQTSINKKIKKYKNKKPWKIIPIVILVLLALCVVGLLTFLVWRDRECEEHEYKEGGGCYECDESCKMCERGDAESCTECGRDEWLLVKRQEDRVGKCSEECMGVKDEKNKHCIVQLAKREERRESGNISWET